MEDVLPQKPLRCIWVTNQRAQGFVLDHSAKRQSGAVPVMHSEHRKHGRSAKLMCPCAHLAVASKGNDNCSPSTAAGCRARSN